MSTIMPENKSEDIGKILEKANQGQGHEHALEFDPESGELVVRRKDELKNPDATSVDQIATDGFA